MARKRKADSGSEQSGEKRAHKDGTETNGTTAGPAQNTLYISNLNDQVSSSDLRTALYMLFSDYGHVVAVNAHKSPKMRGQAHIAFDSLAHASDALKHTQGKYIFGKPLKVFYARSPSDRLKWLEG